MSELIDMMINPSHPDDRKGAVIEVAGYGAAGFAGASVGAAISKLDGATDKWNETQASHGVPSSNVAVNHNLLTGCEVFGPIAFGTVAGLALMRKLIKSV
jgi:hypothetical protein